MSRSDESESLDPREVDLFRREVDALRTVPDKDAAVEDAVEDAAGSSAGLRRPRPKMSRRLRRRQQTPPRIHETIDLHGTGRREAVERLDRELPAALARGARRVLVITGRGRGSVGQVPVVRGAVVTWFRLEGRRWVERWEPAERGGEGALLVWLRKQR